MFSGDPRHIKIENKVFIELEEFMRDIKGEMPNGAFDILIIDELNIDHSFPAIDVIVNRHIRIRQISIRVNLIEEACRVERLIWADTEKEFFNVEDIRVNLKVNRIIVRANGSKNNRSALNKL